MPPFKTLCREAAGSALPPSMDMRMILTISPFPPIPIFIFVIGPFAFLLFSCNVPHPSVVFIATFLSIPLHLCVFVSFDRLVYQGRCLPSMKREMNIFIYIILTCLFQYHVLVVDLHGSGSVLSFKRACRSRTVWSVWWCCFVVVYCHAYFVHSPLGLVEGTERMIDELHTLKSGIHRAVAPDAVPAPACVSRNPSPIAD